MSKDDKVDHEKIAQLEKERDELIKQAVGVHRRRLEGLQWQCDRILKKYGDNHVGAAVEMSKMMMESLSKLHSILTAEDANQVLGNREQEAKVLAFKPKIDNNEDPTIQ